jgi:hypothetical protein
LDLSRRVGRGDIWRRQWELLENRVYNKRNGCSAIGALAPGPDHHHLLRMFVFLMLRMCGCLDFRSVHKILKSEY